jgi:hypothetical protein
MEHRDQDQIRTSSCERPVEEPPRPAEEQQIEVTKEDEEIARKALAARMARKHPTRPTPRWFDARELAMVVACVGAVGGDSEAKRLAQSDAIAGAFIASKDGPPTVRFIWEKIDHFLDHVERGRRRRLAEERNARMRAEPERSLPRPTRGPAPPAIPHEQMAADLEKLFGADWRKHASR